MSAPVLVFGWGNPSRGDDALGPRFVELFAELVTRHPEWGPVDFLTDFQLQVEHALDLQGRTHVLFVDAAGHQESACVLQPLVPSADATLSSHAMSPQAVLQVYTDIEDEPPPSCWLLTIRATDFVLGQPLSDVARLALGEALLCAAEWIDSRH